jgi:DNA-binding CsgD family transcriptional regulator
MEVKLSKRQLEIVQLLSEGSTQRTISRQLGIAYRTVKNTLRGVRDKTGMDTTPAAIAWCLRNGLIK